RLRAHRGSIGATLRMRDRSRPDRHSRDLEEFAVVLEHFVRECLDHDLGGLGEAGPGLAHGNAEALVLDRGGAAAEAEQAAPAAHDVEQRDLLGYAHRIMPRQHDHRRAELHPLRPPGEIGERLGRRRRHRVAGEMMLERKDRVEAERLRQIGESIMLADHLGLRATRLLLDAYAGANLHRRLLPLVGAGAGPRRRTTPARSPAARYSMEARTPGRRGFGNLPFDPPSAGSAAYGSRRFSAPSSAGAWSGCRPSSRSPARGGRRYLRRDVPPR